MSRSGLRQTPLAFAVSSTLQTTSNLLHQIAILFYLFNTTLPQKIMRSINAALYGGLPDAPGWAAAEAVIGVKQNYESTAPYKDVPVTTTTFGWGVKKAQEGLISLKEQKMRISVKRREDSTHTLAIVAYWQPSKVWCRSRTFHLRFDPRKEQYVCCVWPFLYQRSLEADLIAMTMTKVSRQMLKTTTTEAIPAAPSLMHTIDVMKRTHYKKDVVNRGHTFQNYDYQG